jgi:hypothetical protein
MAPPSDPFSSASATGAQTTKNGQLFARPSSSFHSNGTSFQSLTKGTGHSDQDMPDGSDIVDDDEMDVLHVIPGAFPRGGRGKWKDSGRGILAAVSPVGGEVTAWVSKNVCISS